MIKQYGAIPFMRSRGAIRVVLVTSSRGCWIFPKGNLEEAHGTCGTAQLEAFEEAGVKGIVYPHQICRTNIILRSGKRARMALFPLEVVAVFDQWPESDRRHRRIVWVAEARQLIESEGLKRCLGAFVRDFLFEE